MTERPEGLDYAAARYPQTAYMVDLSYQAQRDHGVARPRGICDVCTVEYGLLPDNRMHSHGARGNPCPGSHKPAAGLKPAEDA